MRKSKPPSRAFAAILPLLGVLLLTGCTTSRWQFVRERPPIKIVTKVSVRTEPPGAEISVNGNYQDRSPVEIPVRYPVTRRVYERRVALPYPQVEEREVPIYSGNVYLIEANLLGYDSASRSVSLRGEETMEVVIKLEKRRD